MCHNTADRLHELAEKLNNSGPELSKEDKMLLKVAVYEHITILQDEQRLCWLTGNMPFVKANTNRIEQLMEMTN